MTRLFLPPRLSLITSLLACLVITGCGSGPIKRAIFQKTRQGLPLEAWPKSPSAGARIHFQMELQLHQDGLAAAMESEADLNCGVWKHGNSTRYIFLEPNTPPYTLLAYTRLGFMSRSDHVDCRVLGFADEREETRSFSDLRIQRWKTENAHLVGTDRAGKTIFFQYEGDPRGHLGFHRRPNGRLPKRAGLEVDPRSILQCVQSRYEYRDEDAPRVDYHPNTYRALTDAIRAWEDSPFPAGQIERIERLSPGATWEIENRAVVRSLLRTAVRISRRLGSQFDDSTRVPFTVEYRLLEWSPQQLIMEGTGINLESIVLGSRFRYSIKDYQRRVVYDRIQKQITEDRLMLEAKGTQEETVRFSLELTHNPSPLTPR
ncbi:MAG: hypothetical protein QF752_14650 [Planctomycetota bacterium]|nr:hypothetical protein [Planctomycetota bacterium]